MNLQRLLVPGLVIQAVMVGGGYATGRELVEFFLSNGPVSALFSMGITALLFSVAAAVSFELARLHRAFDYRSFCRVFLGRFVFLFELGYFAALMLTLSVVSAGGERLLTEMIGSSVIVNGIIFTALVALLVFFGNTFLERVISAWSIIFYTVYGTMMVLVIERFGPTLLASLDAMPLLPGRAAFNSISYTGYNIPVLPVLIFVARNFQSRREALLAGVLTGPMILLPGIALLLALSAFYPGVLSAPLPVSVVLEKLQAPWLTHVVQLVILGALLKTGAGLLHGLNERIARLRADRGLEMPLGVRSTVAVAAMILSVGVATSFGIIDLIKYGYRFASYFFLLIFLLPLLTRGVGQILIARK